MKILIWRDEQNIQGDESGSESEEPVGGMLKFPLLERRPKFSNFTTYQGEDLFSAKRDIVIAIPADMNPKSPKANKIVGEFSDNELFKMRPQVGHVLSVKRILQSCIHLLCSRESNQNPIFKEDLDVCVTRIAELLCGHTLGRA